MALPPGPRSMLRSTLGYLRDPYGSALRTQARHGDTYTLPTTFGTMVVTGDPEGVREILAAVSRGAHARLRRLLARA